MVELTDLSNELLLEIGTHITKPIHVLSFVLINRQNRRLLIPLLYESITVHHTDNTSTQQIHSRNSEKDLPDRLWLLTNNLRTKNINLGHAIKSLEIHIKLDDDLISCSPAGEVCRIFVNLHSLKALKLTMTAPILEQHQTSLPQDRVPPAQIAGALRGSVIDTIESLVLVLGQHLPHTDDSAFGSLADFTELKRLCIQSYVLLGNTRSGTGLDGGMQTQSMLSSLLPPSLQHLRVHSCSQDIHEQAMKNKRLYHDGIYGIINHLAAGFGAPHHDFQYDFPTYNTYEEPGGERVV